MPQLTLKFRSATLLLAGLLCVLPARARVSPAKRILARAHRLHQALLRQPRSARTPGQFLAIVHLLAPLRRQRNDAQAAQAAYYDSAGLEVELAQTTHSYAVAHAAWLRAVHFYYTLLLRYPYSQFRRNVDWSLAQIEWSKLDLRAPARTHLRDFLLRYPADPRASAARRELRGEIRGSLPILSGSALAKLGRRALISRPVPPSPAPALSARPQAAARPAGLAAVPVALNASSDAYFQHLHVWHDPGAIRLVLFLTRRVPISWGTIVSRHILFLDLHGCATAWVRGLHTYPVADPGLRYIRAGQNQADIVRVVVGATAALALTPHIHFYPNPARYIITLTRISIPAAPVLAQSRTPAIHPPQPAVPASAHSRTVSISSNAVPPGAPIRPRPLVAVRRLITPRPPPVRPVVLHPSAPLPNGRRSLTRALDLGIRRIVIDPGHGGHDTGTIGPNGLYEKNVVLGVALKLGRLLRRRLGVRVFYTRDRDVFIPLTERTAIANRDHADLFISIHANASSDPQVSGIETYYLNFTQNPQALAVAARENAGSGYDIHNLGGLITKIAIDNKMQESRQLAHDVEISLVRGLHEPDRHVKSAPFIVLIGARMPSILTEISFLSNPYYARRLGQSWYQQRIALDIYRGIARYVHSLGGPRIVRAQNHPLRQPAHIMPVHQAER